MMKNTTVLSSMIDSLIQKLKWGALVTSISLLPLPVMANTVKVERYSTNGDEVTLRVSARKDDNSPIEGLTEKQFEIETEGQTIQPNFAPKSARDKAYVVILLDMSGSMKNPDSGTKTQSKLSGAINAIRKFIDQASDEDIDLKISLVPFGYTGEGTTTCKGVFDVNESTITQNPFLDVTTSGSKLISRIQELEKVKVCASTKLAEPLLAAKDYLQKQVKEENSLTNQVPPKLITILLSDGYDDSNKQQVKELVRKLKPQTENEPFIKVYTLGYGESLEQLRNRAQCNTAISDSDLTAQSVSQNCILRNGDIREFIIDEYLLETVANSTGGIYKLSANSTEVAKSFIDILKSEREYKLVYKQPRAESGSSHKISVRVIDPKMESEPTKIEFPIFQKLSLLERSGIFVFIGVLCYVGINSFRQWSRQLKQQADSSLDG